MPVVFSEMLLCEGGFSELGGGGRWPVGVDLVFHCFIGFSRFFFLRFLNIFFIGRFYLFFIFNWFLSSVIGYFIGFYWFLSCFFEGFCMFLSFSSLLSLVFHVFFHVHWFWKWLSCFIFNMLRYIHFLSNGQQKALIWDLVSIMEILWPDLMRWSLFWKRLGHFVSQQTGQGMPSMTVRCCCSPLLTLWASQAPTRSASETKWCAAQWFQLNIFVHFFLWKRLFCDFPVFPPFQLNKSDGR